MLCSPFMDIKGLFTINQYTVQTILIKFNIVFMPIMQLYSIAFYFDARFIKYNSKILFA